MTNDYTNDPVPPEKATAQPTTEVFEVPGAADAEQRLFEELVFNSALQAENLALRTLLYEVQEYRNQSRVHQDDIYAQHPLEKIIDKMPGKAKR